jgi:hypothetical protein
MRVVLKKYESKTTVARVAAYEKKKKAHATSAWKEPRSCVSLDASKIGIMQD